MTENKLLKNEIKNLASIINEGLNSNNQTRAFSSSDSNKSNALHNSINTNDNKILSLRKGNISKKNNSFSNLINKKNPKNILINNINSYDSLFDPFPEINKLTSAGEEIVKNNRYNLTTHSFRKKLLLDSEENKLNYIRGKKNIKKNPSSFSKYTNQNNFFRMTNYLYSKNNSSLNSQFYDGSITANYGSKIKLNTENNCVNSTIFNTISQSNSRQNYNNKNNIIDNNKVKLEIHDYKNYPEKSSFAKSNNINFRTLNKIEKDNKLKKKLLIDEIMTGRNNPENIRNNPKDKFNKYVGFRYVNLNKI